MLEMFHRFSPDDVVIIYQKGELKRWQFQKLVSLLVMRFKQLQLEPGARVLIVLPNSLELLVSYYACMAAGLIAVPVNERLAKADISRIFVAGHSAGGQQVGMLCETDWQGEYGLPDDIIKGGIPISGVFDLHPLRYSYLQPKLLLTHEIILRQSPYLNIPRSAPPLLITFGEDETKEFHRQSTDFLQAWRANGLEGELLVQEGKHHFSAIEGLTDENSSLCNAVIDFMIGDHTP